MTNPLDQTTGDSSTKNTASDIKGITRAQLLGDNEQLHLLCPTDATLCEAALAFPYNGRNYHIQCGTCKQSYYIALNWRTGRDKTKLDYESLVKNLEVA